MLDQKPLLGSLPNYVHPLTPNVGAWFMNECSGNKFFDLSGNGNHGTMANSTWSDNGILIDADGEIMSAPSKDITASKGTFDFLYRKRALAGPADFAKFIWTSGTEFQLLRNNSNTSLNLLINSSTQLFATPNIFDGFKHRIQATWNENTNIRRLWIDGIKMTDGTNAFASIALSTPVYFGNRNDGLRGFQGIMYHAFLYNFDLQSSQISQLYIDPYCWLAQPTETELLYAPSLPPVLSYPSIASKLIAFDAI